jgi:hypothetical protein
MESATQSANSSDPSRVLNPSGSALALQAASVIDLGPIAPGQKPVPGFDIPLPRQRPADAPLATASIPAAPVTPDHKPSGPFPRPNPLR